MKQSHNTLQQSFLRESNTPAEKPEETTDAGNAPARDMARQSLSLPEAAEPEKLLSEELLKDDFMLVDDLDHLPV